MRAFLSLSALIAMFAAPTATATGGLEGPTSLLQAEADPPPPPSRLFPLAADSVWTPRFAAVASELAAALRSGVEAQWVPLMGGQWLSAADRHRIGALLRDRDRPFYHAFSLDRIAPPVLLGWRAATRDDERRIAIETGQQAETLVCWSAVGQEDAVWPVVAADADNRPGSSAACARIVYSLRGERPSWRAFIEQSGGDGDVSSNAAPPSARLTNRQSSSVISGA